LEDYGLRNKYYQALRNSEEYMVLKKKRDGVQYAIKDLQMTLAAQFAQVSNRDLNALHGLNQESLKISIFTILMRNNLIKFQSSCHILRMKIHSKVMTALMIKTLL
jgi:hypothetical protein